MFMFNLMHSCPGDQGAETGEGPKVERGRAEGRGPAPAARAGKLMRSQYSLNM